MSTQQEERQVPQWTLGDRLRKALGDVSAQEMADYLGVSRQTLSRWMGDKGAPPKRAFLIQWAMRTNVDVDWLEHGLPRTQPTPPDDGPTQPDALRKLTATKKGRTRRSNTTERTMPLYTIPEERAA